MEPRHVHAKIQLCCRAVFEIDSEDIVGAQTVELLSLGIMSEFADTPRGTPEGCDRAGPVVYGVFRLIGRCLDV